MLFVPILVIFLVPDMIPVKLILPTPPILKSAPVAVSGPLLVIAVLLLLMMAPKELYPSPDGMNVSPVDVFKLKPLKSRVAPADMVVWS